ncbi:site-specific integrase [Nonomuraea soli]|uniref:Integrase n=1 Tax=Nonomuraea soli TaxID=1032476 RepID=A0A7W0HNP8_9ACTN|nr:site-specific integrase [Nonomuraea soli]MBA2889957.1 integrase [Nonomuraea soli]
MEQAVRDAIIDRNPAKVTGWLSEYKKFEDELDDPRTLSLPVKFAASTAARIGEVSGVRVADIDTTSWTWTVHRQTTPSPGGLVDKGTKGKRARKVPIIAEVRELVPDRIAATDRDPAARLLTGPRGGRISTAILRNATHWDEVVTKLG